MSDFCDRSLCLVAKENSTEVQTIDETLFNRILSDAEKSPRRRMNYNFHSSMDDNPHRFLNVMLRGTYIQPHRHLNPDKDESFIIFRGKIAVIIFSADGIIEDVYHLSADKADSALLGVDIPAGTWHTLFVLSDHAVCYEVKPGPYRPADDKSFAKWAPAEGEENVDLYLSILEESVRSSLSRIAG